MNGELIGNILIGLYLFLALVCFAIFIYLDKDAIKEYGLPPLKDLATLVVCALIWPIVLVTSIVIYRMDMKNESNANTSESNDKNNDLEGNSRL